MQTRISIRAVIKAVSLTAVVCISLASGPSAGHASSHREAPLITTMPKTDGTDFYMFSSYEPGRSNFVTIVADYQPLQDPFAGPNYYTMDPEALYDINIDNDGDALPEITFRFHFTNTNQNLTVPVGGVNVAVPLVNIGPDWGRQHGELECRRNLYGRRDNHEWQEIEDEIVRFLPMLPMGRPPLPSQLTTLVTRPLAVQPSTRPTPINTFTTSTSRTALLRASFSWVSAKTRL